MLPSCASTMSCSSCDGDIRYKVLWIGEIAKHKGIGETKVLQGKKKAKVLQIYRLPYSVGKLVLPIGVS